MKQLMWAATIAAFLVACGGGGGDAAPSPAAGDGGAASDASASAARADQVSSARLQVGDPSMANTTTAGDQALRAVGARADGGHTVAWWSQDATLRLQHYDGAGRKSGGEVTLAFTVDGVVATLVPFVVSGAKLAVAADGGVLVAYSATRDLPPDGQANPPISQGIYVQRFDPGGLRVQAETAITTRTERSHYRTPALVVDHAVARAGGGFAIGWSSVAPSSVNIRSDFQHQRLDAQGQLLGSPAPLGSYLGGGTLRLAADTLGGYTVAISHVVYDGGAVPRIAITHVLADGSARALVPERNGQALLLPLSDRRYVLFSGSGGTGATRQLLEADGTPARAPLATPSVPSGAWQLADGTFAALFAGGNGAALQRYNRAAETRNPAVPLATGAAVPEAASLATAAGVALAWSAATGATGEDVYTQRVAASH